MIAENVETAAPRSDWDRVHRYDVGEAIKAWVMDELAPDLGASFAADLLGYAFDLVDWYEIADAWIETADDIHANA